MSLESALAALTPEIYQNLKRAVELGKWPDGKRLTPEQLENSMQLVIAWEFKHLPEQQRTGYIDRGKKAKGEVCGDDHSVDSAAQNVDRLTNDVDADFFLTEKPIIFKH